MLFIYMHMYICIALYPRKIRTIKVIENKYNIKKEREGERERERGRDLVCKLNLTPYLTWQGQSTLACEETFWEQQLFQSTKEKAENKRIAQGRHAP